MYAESISVEAYLERIDYQGSLTPTLSTLNQLHLSHMQTVPFENLDITLGHPIKLSLPAMLDKIVNRKRGGFCYELNAAFAWLLRELGFSVECLAARVFKDEVPGPQFSHLLLLVKAEQSVIADVGFGDSFLLPLIPGDNPSYQLDRYYRVLVDDEQWIMQQRFESDDWESRYIFDLQQYQLEDYDAMCAYHQTSEMSIFTRSTVCSRATRQGRVTYTNGRFMRRNGVDRDEIEVENKNRLGKILSEHFNFSLSDEKLDRLITAIQTQSSFGE